MHISNHRAFRWNMYRDKICILNCYYASANKMTLKLFQYKEPEVALLFKYILK